MKKYLNTSLGILGLTLTIIGTFLDPNLIQKTFFISGASLLLVSSILEKASFFIILEIIVLAGTLVAFFPISTIAKAGVPVTLSIVSIIYLAKQGILHDRVNIVGCLGLLFLATGFAISNPIIYFLGGLTLSIYSYLSYRVSQLTIALLFAILNAVFTVTSVISIIKLFA